ncbi:MAG: ribosome biogenesis GTPase Der [Candidatus Doudnabacteria bacterium]|nr:ribosome biogenesis GTPase Der [Candidatus Doudnabacteria bacterium]
MNNLPLVAIVGQPNAGKSTFMNKIAGKPLAVTSDIAGTTRDRQYIDTTWSGVDFTLVDTAGLSAGSGDQLELSLLKQIDVAVQEADIIAFVVDGKEPLAAIDQTSLKKFRNTKKPLLLVINKLDSARIHEAKKAEFQKLGIKNVFTVSSLTGLGLGDFLEEVTDTLKKLGLADKKTEEKKGIAVSIVGKPNVGKSSIFNAILKEERVVVSPIPGTTRTAIDSQLEIGGENYIFIDTAGLKKKEHRQPQPDVFSGFQTFKAIRRSDICFFVIDANEEITKQDQRVANEIFAMEKGCIILVNKMDAYTKDNRGKKGGKWDGRGETDDEYKTLRDYISHHFSFLWMCPAFFVSAVTGEGLDEALAAIKPIFEARHKEIDQETLTAFLAKKMKINPPKLLRDQKKPKVTGLRQIATNPPMFELLVNHPAAISMQFRKFLENGIIKDLDFWGTPITLKLKGKDKA